MLEKCAYEASCDNQYREWEVNLKYAKYLAKEIGKYMNYECVGPLIQEDGQIVYAEMEYEIIKSINPDLIIRFEVEHRRIHLFEKWINYIHMKEKEKYKITIPLYPDDELISIAQLIDENLTSHLRVNNFIETKPLPLSQMIQFSPGNLFNAEEAERMMQEEVIKRFCMSIVAAIQTVYGK